MKSMSLKAKKKHLEKTLRLAVIGHPISHSRSPLMHQAAIRKTNLNATYSAVDVETKNLKNFFQEMRQGKYDGVNVTIPHKQKVIRLMDSLSPEARHIGAVNTVVRRGKKLWGMNTDGAGYLRSLFTQTRLKFKNKNILLVGSGGAALAIADAIASTGITHLIIANRTQKNALTLKRRLKKNYPKLDISFLDTELLFKNTKKIAELLHNVDLIINSTTLGMSGQPWPSLGFVSHLKKSCVVSDIVYIPRQTALLKRAQKQKLKIHEGYGMLLFQGAIAFEKFTGHIAPLSNMKKALLRSL